MTKAIADASAFGSLIIPDESDELIPGFLECLRGDDIMVPQHWPLEIGNLMRMAIKRGRLAATDIPKIIGMLQRARIEIDKETVDHAWVRTHDYASKHDLTAYDAAYLELATRTGRALITTDKALVRAAIKEKVQVLTR